MLENPYPKRTLAILGMHRSGTSCLAGSLQRAGLYLGKFYTWNHHNHQGNRENPDILPFHQQLLADNHGSWDNPPEHIIWQDAHIARAKEILQLYKQAPLWGFKDPRTLLTLDGWRQFIDIECIGIYRHPVAVVESLHQRGGFSKAVGWQLWVHYNQLLIDEYEKQPFPILSFDWSEALFHEKLEKVTPQWGLHPIAKEDRFFTPKLRTNNRFQNHELPEQVQSLYNKLQEISQN